MNKDMYSTALINRSHILWTCPIRKKFYFESRVIKMNTFDSTLLNFLLNIERKV